MYDASAGTLTDQVAGSASADVAVNAVAPTVTVMLTPASEPVSPDIVNPAVFSAMFTVSSTAIVSRFSASVPAARTVTVSSWNRPPASVTRSVNVKGPVSLKSSGALKVAVAALASVSSTIGSPVCVQA